MLIDLTLSDSDDEVGPVGPHGNAAGRTPDRKVAVDPDAAKTGTPVATLKAEDIDSDDDRPLNCLKEELLAKSPASALKQAARSSPQGAHQQSPFQQQQQQQSAFLHQQGSQQQEQEQPQRQPPRKLVSKKSATALSSVPSQPSASATQQQQSPLGAGGAAAACTDESPCAAGAAANRARASPSEKENTSPFSWGGVAAPGSGSSSERRKQRRRSGGLQPIIFDDLDSCFDEPLHERLSKRQCQQQPPASTSNDSPHRHRPGQQLEPQQFDVSKKRPAAAAAAAAAAHAVVDEDDDDEEILFCHQPGSASWAKGAGLPQQQKQQTHQQQQPDVRQGEHRTASGLESGGFGELNEFEDLLGSDFMAKDDHLWEPVNDPAAAEADDSDEGGDDDDAGMDASDDEFELGRSQAAAAKQERGRRHGASSRPAAEGTSADTAAGRGGTGRGRVKLTAEERAAERAAERARKAADKAAEKERKQAEKVAAKLARQAEVQASKDAKRFDAFINRKLNGRFGEYEAVVVMDSSTANSALGLAISAELERRKTMAWQVLDALPLTNKWPGCCCFCFKRRQLCEGDEHLLKTATTARVHQFTEDVQGCPRYVQLVFEQPASLLQHLQADQLASMMTAVSAAHPNCSLGVIVLGLKSHIRRIETQELRQGSSSGLDWRRVTQQLLQLELTTPGLQLRLLNKQEEAAAHIINTARAVGQQPYTAETQLEAFGGSGPGAASKAAAAGMLADLGPTTSAFAVSTLGKMHGMGGNKAWAVAKVYPSLGALITAFEDAAHRPGGAPSLLLQDLTEPQAAGKAKPRRVGPAMSKRLHLLFTSQDPDAIVEAAGDAE